MAPRVGGGPRETKLTFTDAWRKSRIGRYTNLLFILVDRTGLEKGTSCRKSLAASNTTPRCSLGADWKVIFPGNIVRGKGPASRLISIFSDDARKIGVTEGFLVAPIPLKKSAPDFFLNGKIETEYREQLLSGEKLTSRAGIISAANVDVSFPTSMHRIGDRILNEVMLTPFLLTNPKYYFGLESIRFKRKHPIDEGVLLAMPFYHNFYHWLIEILPQIDLLRSLSKPASHPADCTEVRSRICNRNLETDGLPAKNGLPGRRHLSVQKTPHAFRTRVKCWRFRQIAIEWLNDKFKDVKSDYVSPRNIYVSRSDAKIRFVSNESELKDILGEFGFETMSMTRLSIADQVEVFRNAEFIVGPHGAALANLAFAKPGATLIEFFSRGHYAPCFNRISGIRGMRYGFLVGEPTRIGGFSINPRDLRTVLSQALRSHQIGPL